MCEKKKYNGRRIDPCMVNIIKYINEYVDDIKTIACCCGHNKYKPTIITHNLFDDSIHEFYSKIKLSDHPRKTRKYYKRDKEGYFFIPEIEDEK